MAVHVKGEGELGAELRLDPQQLQHVGVRGGLVSALFRQAALHQSRLVNVPLSRVGENLHHHLLVVHGDQSVYGISALDTGDSLLLGYGVHVLLGQA